MDQPKHTPGPWRALRSWEGYFEPDADELDSYMRQPYTRIEAADGNTIVAAHDCFTFTNPANAHLIAAAPELLKALQDLVKALPASSSKTPRERWNAEVTTEIVEES